MDDLRDLYQHMLKDAYSAEKQVLEALPKLAETASHPELRQAFEHHLEETQGHFDTIGKILEGLGINPGNKMCHGMEGLVSEGKELIEERNKIDKAVLDAGLITAAQKVEHYEISNYGTMREFAHVLGHSDHVQVLNQILDEEYAADQTLTALAKNGLNVEARSK
jgi:ferritin-like metal-binding protein YciE